MKKLLAIILTAVMLVSMFATCASAASQIVYQDPPTANNYWHFTPGNSWHPVKFDNPDGVIELDIKLDAEDSALGCYGLSNAPSISTTYVGLKDGSISIPYTFALDTWYHVKWVSNGSSTEIFVNGASVGSVSAGISYYDGNQFYWAPVKLSMDNVSMGGQTFDFEGDNSRWNTESGQGELEGEELPGAIHNELVGYGVNHYWHFTPGNSWHPVKFNNPGMVVELDIKLDAEDSSLGCYGLSNAPSVGTTYVGLKDNSISVPYTFDLDTWYHIKWLSEDGSTTISVNGVEVGTVGATLSYYDGNQFYWAPVKLSMDNVEVGDQKFTFEGDNSAWNTESGQGEVEGEEIETYRAELGAHYWYFSPGNSWHPVKFDNPGKTIELDIKLDGESSSLGCYGLSNAPSMGINYVGLKDNTLKVDYAFKADTWYHIKWKTNSAGTKTTIYVDGNKVGTVAAGISYYDGNQFYWAPDKLSMDNVSMGGQVFDFEGDVSRWNTESGQGDLMDYDLTIGSSNPCDNITKYEVGGQAWLLSAEIAQNNIYTDISGMNPHGKDYIINFDLAIASNADERNTPGYADKSTYFELWSDSATTRFKVGPFTGCNDDLTVYDWGELSLHNFHNITYYVKGSVNKIQVYIDDELVYEGKSGSVWTDRFLGMMWNGSAILDNVQVMNLDYENYNVNLNDNSCYGALKSINLDSDCSGRNTGNPGGHINGTTVNTKMETCLAEGTITTTCAWCGGTYDTAIAKLSHIWPSYNEGSNVVAPTENTDGVREWSCKRGCGTTCTTSLPAYKKYTGEIWKYIDCSDATTVRGVMGKFGSDDLVIHDGYVEFPLGSSDNYNDNYNMINCKYNYSVSFDFKNVKIFDTGDTHNSDGSIKYGHEFYFWFGGSDGISNQAGYNFDEGYYFLRPYHGKAFDEQRAYIPYVDDGKWHTLTLVYNVEDEDTAYVGLLVDGEQVVAVEDTYDCYDILGVAGQFETLRDWVIFRDFGVAAKLDNLVIGSSDFKWAPKPVVGDVNGDGKITAADLLCLKYYIAEAYDDSDIVFDAADANGDGEITVADYVAVKDIILGLAY